jgi:hypothetical protein
VTRTRTGLFIVRPWAEPGSSLPLRAPRFAPTTNVSLRFQHSLTVAQVEAVAEAVQAWLSEMLASSPTEDGPDSP